MDLMGGKLGVKKAGAAGKAKASAVSASASSGDAPGADGPAAADTISKEDQHALDNLNEHSFTRNQAGKEKLKLFIRAGHRFDILIGIRFVNPFRYFHKDLGTPTP